jgi:SAM-dependent methyltransferase
MFHVLSAINKIITRLTTPQKPENQAIYDRTGRLRLTGLLNENSGLRHNVVLNIVDGLRFEIESIDPPIENHIGNIDFKCNVCATDNFSVPLRQVAARETQTCRNCGSSVRTRSVINALSVELYKKSMSIDGFSVDKGFYGLGLSDWDGYALPLAAKFQYTNTFLHESPRLDITEPQPEHMNRYDFLISSDVFEHVESPVKRAFDGAYRVLKSGGILVFTVPYHAAGRTNEHFPDLYDWRIIEHHGKRFLYNKTEAGEEQIWDSLVFHGGDGQTLEMRRFSEPDIVDYLTDAGFIDIKVHKENCLEFGILHSTDWSLPITAKKP